MKLKFENHKEKLFEILLGENHDDGFLSFIEPLSSQGKSKKEIYELFLVFHREIQIDPRTQHDEDMYDRLADFMDGFTVWGKSFSILPDEPDL